MASRSRASRAVSGIRAGRIRVLGRCDLTAAGILTSTRRREALNLDDCEISVTPAALIITHQQQTMEAGDVLYGVTMEPGGSSKVVAKSMAQAAAELEQSVGR